MNAVSKTTAFPATVQPGIPKLADLPTGWIEAPLGRFLHEVRRPIKMNDNTKYRLLTVKRARGGVVEREHLLGAQVSVKSQFNVEKGDFLISKRQIVHGACGIVPVELEGSIVSNEYAVLNGNSEINLKFLNYLAHSIFFQQTCFHSSIGVHVEKMIFKTDRWLKWIFHLPPIPEQKKIAEILSTWDRAIEVTEKLLENATCQKRALMQQLLTGKRRFPEFEGTEWQEIKLNELCFVDEKSLMGRTDQDFEFDYISLSNVTSGTVIRPLENYRFGDAPSRARRIVRDNDILFSTVRPNLLGIAKVDASLENCIASTGFAVLTPRRATDASYIYHYLFSHHAKSQYHALVVGSNYPAVNSSEMKNIKVYCPDGDERDKIGEALNISDGEIQKLDFELAILRLEKKALMQQLLTGKKRVVVA